MLSRSSRRRTRASATSRTFALSSASSPAVWLPSWAWPIPGSYESIISRKAQKYATTVIPIRSYPSAWIETWVRSLSEIDVMIRYSVISFGHLFVQTQRLVVCLEERIDIHNISDMRVIHTIRDIPSNPKGLCALSVDNEKSYLGRLSEFVEIWTFCLLISNFFPLNSLSRQQSGWRSSNIRHHQSGKRVSWPPLSLPVRHLEVNSWPLSSIATDHHDPRSW